MDQNDTTPPGTNQTRPASTWTRKYQNNPPEHFILIDDQLETQNCGALIAFSASLIVLSNFNATQ